MFGTEWNRIFSSEYMYTRHVLTLLEIASQRHSGLIVRKPIKISNNSKGVPHEIRDINLTNAVIYSSVIVEGTLSGQDSCHLNFKYFPQAGRSCDAHSSVFYVNKRVCNWFTAQYIWYNSINTLCRYCTFKPFILSN